MCTKKTNKIIPGVNDLMTVSTAAHDMWDYEKNTVDPKTIGSKSNIKAWWKCQNGHSFQRIVSVFTETQQCPICKIEELSIIKQPQIMKFFDVERNHDVNPASIVPSSQKILWWKCPNCGYSWQAQVRSRKSGLCPCCDLGTAIMPGYNDALSVAPAVREDFDQSLNPDIDITILGAASKKTPITWRCHTCGYIWKSTIYSRLRGQDYRNGKMNLCPVCGGAKRKQSFTQEYPELAKRFDDSNSISFQQISGTDYHKNFWWKCSIHGKHYSSLSSMIRAIKTSSSGCPFCEKKQVFPGEGLADLYPEILSQWYEAGNILLGIKPENVSIGSETNVWWQCNECGTVYLQPINQHVAFYNRGIVSCPTCKGIKKNISHITKSFD